MDKSDSIYHWDKEFFEKKISLLTNCQLGFVGAALMLMMMNLSKIYLLAPLGVGLILASWYKHHLEQTKDQMKNMSVEIAPKSILLKLPSEETETRVTFREIEEINQHKENMVQIITLYLKENEDKLEIKALKDSDKFVSTLKTQMAEQLSDQ
ncbi:hypothetical protein ACMXYX_09605 [Neptuniibacter sp. QD72_48]|uniref:hypothetical protein n=1 Tax=unclassified Neptuniibacter TaxID=2630693 RepID=UPI0039F57960